MQSILKVAISFTILMISSVFLVAQAGQKNVCNTAKDITKPQIYKYEQISKICIDSQLFSLTYNYPKRLLSITSHQSGQRIYYDKLQKGYNPEYVMGGDGEAIRFLPMKLQPYLNQGKVLYFSSTRTTAGNGMGQCGAGLETFLNVFDIKSKRPVRVSSILISSCTENIELAIRNPTLTMLITRIYR